MDHSIDLNSSAPLPAASPHLAKQRLGLSSVAQGHVRLMSIDLLRGLIIVLMALDHTRGFWGGTPFNPLDLAHSTPAWFLTRWITHYCAPLFIFLTGVSAYLYGQKAPTRAALQAYLCSRGLWLILLEISVINLSWQFSYPSLFLQVIWAIGCSMLILALLVMIPRRILLPLCLACIALHNSFNDAAINAFLGEQHWLWSVLHQKEHIALGNHSAQAASGFFIGITYPLFPWFAVMALGYCAGALYQTPAARRQTILLGLGFGVTALFVVLRWFAAYGDPMVWQAEANGINSLLSFLNTTKYPPSLQYLCMTIGPGFIVLALLERVQEGSLGYTLLRFLRVFGSVPLFFYLVHIPLLNLCAHIYAYWRYGEWTNFVYQYSHWPASYKPDLYLVYAAWLSALLLLYWPCKYYGELKRRSKLPLLAYL